MTKFRKPSARVVSAQHLAGLRVDQMRLGARKARHLDVSEVIVFGVISGPSLDVVTCVGAAVEERRHQLYNLILSHRTQRVAGMNEQAQACLRKAEECEHSAQRTRDDSARLLYLDLAKHWRTLAAYVETMDRQRAIFQQSEPNMREPSGASELLQRRVTPFCSPR